MPMIESIKLVGIGDGEVGKTSIFQTLFFYSAIQPEFFPKNISPLFLKTR